MFSAGNPSATDDDVDVSTIMLNDTIPVSLLDVPTSEPVPTEIGDYDEDGIPDLMVKFDRAEVASWIVDDLGIEYGDVTLTITGELFDGTPFEGSDVIRVLFPSDVDGDGDVDYHDFLIFAGCYCNSVEDSSYDPRADFNEDECIDYNDFLILAENYLKTAV